MTRSFEYDSILLIILQQSLTDIYDVVMVRDVFALSPHTTTDGIVM